MKSHIKNLINTDKFLCSSEKNYRNIKYQIPHYQRHYDWESENAINLFTDIGEAVQNRKPHYTGSFLFFDTNPVIVIDGQQRIITTFLFLKAFQLVCNSNEVKQNINKILFIDDIHMNSGTLRLIVSKLDEANFKKILVVIKNGSSISQYDDGSKIFLNFKLAYDYFKNLKQQFSDEEIFKYGFGSLQICELMIEKDKDDEPQKIFRDLNSKGQNLKNSDLIRNFLLMENDDLYDQWQEIESIFTKNNEFQSDLFEEFIFNYVLLKKPEKINENKIFNAFVTYCQNPKNEFSEDGKFISGKAVEDLLNYAKIYQYFINLNENNDKKYKSTISLLKELRDMSQTTAYPFLMRVFKDEKDGNISIDVLNKVINLIVIYHVRASICKVPSGSLRGYLLTMYKNIFEYRLENKIEKNYFAAIYKYLDEEGKKAALPSEAQFLFELKKFDLYSNKALCRYILKTIVNNRYPKEQQEKTIIEKPTIEHLLPQNPNDEWKKELGGEAKLNAAMEFVHTIGNLSLANQEKNSELGNKSKKDKVKILNKYGECLSVLNKGFIKLEEQKKKFSLKFIKDRADDLIEILKNYYYLDLKNVDTSGIYFENFDIIDATNESTAVFTYRDPKYIEIENKSFRVESFKDASNKIFNIIDEQYSDKLHKIIERKLFFKNHQILSDIKLPGYNELINSNIYYYNERNGTHLYYCGCLVLRELGVSPENIKILLRKQNNEENLRYKIVDIMPEQFKDIFCLKRNNRIIARAIYDGGNMIVLKDSFFSKICKPYFNDCFVDLKNKLVSDKIINEDNKFMENVEFRSPSAASNAILGQNSNGQQEWVLESDQSITLKEYLKNKE